MLLARVERYLRVHRMPPTRFGREAIGDPSFVLDLQAGRQPRTRTIERVDAYMNKEAAPCS